MRSKSSSIPSFSSASGRNHFSSATISKQSPKPGYVKPLSAKQRGEEDSEERLIQFETSPPQSRPTSRWSPLPLPTVSCHVSSVKEAMRRSFRESNSFMLDWTSLAAGRIGKCCKVYWDGDDTWYYARIINYDHFHDRYFVSGLTDGNNSLEKKI